MYCIISLIVAIIFAFALSSIYNLLITFAIAFVAALCILTFVDTLIEGENLAFTGGCAAFVATAQVWWLWFIYFAPIAIFVAISIVGGIVTAPIWYFFNRAQASTSKNVVLVVMFSVLSAMLVLGVTLLISPITAYKVMHYGWYIGLYIGIPIVALIVAIILKSSGTIEAGATATLVISSIVLIPIMIFGVVGSKNATYRIRTAEDMIAFGNAPTGYNTLFVLENDIDFTGKNTSWFGGQKEFEGVFDGQGYTLSNIVVNAKCKSIDVYGENSPQGLGFVRYNSGIIRNLNFENCQFTIENKSSNIVNFDMFFGIITAYNGRGKIYDCNIIDCQAKYVCPTKATAHTSLTLCGNTSSSKEEYVKNVNVVYKNGVDEDFYKDEYVSWKKVN